MELKKGTVYVLVANVINLLISLFSGFVLPKLLSVESYANIKLFQLYITYIGILHLGYADGMYLKLGGKQLDSIDRKDMISEFKTFKLFQLLITILMCAISVIIKNEILLFCSFVILPVNIGAYLRNLYQATGKFDLYSKFMNINTVLIFLVNLFLLLIIKTDNYYIYIIGYIIAYFIYWMYIEFETNKLVGKERTKINLTYIKNDIKNGFFFMIGNFCNVIFTSIDRMFVQNILGMVKFAFYSFAVSIENLMNVFVTPISTVMYNYLCQKQEIIQVVKLKRIIMIFSAVIIIIVFPARIFIEVWIDKYTESISILFLLFAAQYVSIIVRTVHTNMFKAKREQKKYFLVMMFTVTISIILNIIVYAIWKTIDAFALATLVTNIIWFTLGEIMLKEYKLDTKDYIFFIVELIIFLICGKMKQAFLGWILYGGITIALVYFIEKQEGIYLIKEVRSIIRKYIIKMKGENK